METTTPLFSTSPTHLVVVAAILEGIDSDFLGVYLHHASTHSHTMQCLHNAAITPRCPFYSRTSLMLPRSFTLFHHLPWRHPRADQGQESTRGINGSWRRQQSCSAPSQSTIKPSCWCVLLACCVCMCVLSRIAAHTHTLSLSHTLSRSHMRAICPHRRPC